MQPVLYLLDTSILLHLIRDDAIGRHIDETCNLREQPNRPLVCRVTHGEIWSIAERRGWGQAKRDALALMLRNLTCVEIHHQAVIDAYVELDVHSLRQPAGAQNMGKNDLWIAACARAANATLVTTDKDFDHLYPNLIRCIRIDPEQHRPHKS